MKKKAILSLLLAGMLAMGVLTGCSQSGKEADAQNKTTITVVDTKEHSVEITQSPERVVVLDYGTLDILEELGVENVVGVPQNGLPEYLGSYKDSKYKNIGGVKEFDFEAINELNPDLIIIEGRQADSYDELSKIAPTIQLGTDGANYLNRLKSNAELIGRIFDKEDKIAEKISEIETRMNAIKEKVTADNTDGLFLMVSDGSMSVYGEGSRYNLLFNELGFKSTDSSIEVSNHGQSVSFEYLAQKNPSYLFVVDKGQVTGSNDSAKDLIENEIVKNTDTYKNGNIVYVDSMAWYVGGAGFKSVDKMLTDVENALNM